MESTFAQYMWGKKKLDKVQFELKVHKTIQMLHKKNAEGEKI